MGLLICGSKTPVPHKNSIPDGSQGETVKCLKGNNGECPQDLVLDKRFLDYNIKEKIDYQIKNFPN